MNCGTKVNTGCTSTAAIERRHFSVLEYTGLLFDRGASLMKRKTSIKILTLSVAAMMILMLTSCGGAKVPDDYNYDLSGYIKLGKTSGIEYEKTEVQVSDSDVQSQIDQDIAAAVKTKKVKEGTVASDSTVNIDYVGKINGKKFSGGSAKNVEISIADNNFIDGFADSIVGHNVGDKYDVDLTFPSDYSDSAVAGKTATFTITINSLTVKETPEYNDAFVKKNTKYDTTEEYEAAIRKQLQKKADQQAEETDKQQVFSTILSTSKVKKYPEKELDDRYNKIIDSYKKAAKSNDTTFSKYVKSSTGMTVKQFKSQAKAAAKNMVKQELVLNALADKYDISITSKEYNDYLDDLLKTAGYSKDEFKQATGSTIEQYAEDNNLYDSMLYDKVMTKVMKKSVAK